MDTIKDIITNVGFPIACVIGLGWYVKYITDKNREQIDRIMEQHQSEMKEVTQALNNNTLAITKLTDYMKGDE